jgi:nucleoside-diphosphate-sugar epimerase
MRVLLTGASGFLGRAWALAAPADIEIVALGRTLPEELAGRARLIEANLAEPGALAGVIASGALPGTIDAVVHLAVSRRHREFPDGALDMFEVNTATTARLLDFAGRSGAGHFLLGSTGTVYGGNRSGLLDEERDVAPEAYFAATKRAAELLAERYRGRFAVSVLRFFVPYGPGQSDRLIPDLVARVSDGRPVLLPLEGDGMTFATIHVEDAVRVIGECVEQRWQGTFNVSSEGALTIREAASIIGELIGKAPQFERTESASVLRLVPDLTRLKERIATAGFKAFREGISQTMGRR